MRQPNWKQETPQDQATAIVAGIEGWLDNLQDGTSTVDVAVPMILRQLADLKKLHRQYIIRDWLPSDNG
jgi:hypothetical protein